MRTVVVAANVFVSFFVDRHAAQRDAAEALLLSAVAGDVVAIIPQFVVFETAYVLTSRYGVGADRLAEVIRDIVTFSGGRVVDACPWMSVLEACPRPFDSLADAGFAAVTVANRYDAIATFDRKFANRLRDLGVGTHW